MLVLVAVLMLAQGGLRPNPEAIPPSAPLRVILNGCVEPREPAERQSRQFREHLTTVMNRKELGLTRDQAALIQAVHDAAVPAAFWRYKDAEEKLNAADRKMRAGLSKTALDAIGPLPGRENRYRIC
jgi:hypothetical protein